MMDEKIQKTVYLAGKITGDPYYFSKFIEAENKLRELGLIVLSPVDLPQQGFSWEQYIHVSGAMLDICDRVCFLQDWKDSRGAMYEYGRAVAKEKDIFFYEDWKAKQGEQTK